MPRRHRQPRSSLKHTHSPTLRLHQPGGCSFHPVPGSRCSARLLHIRCSSPGPTALDTGPLGNFCRKSPPGSWRTALRRRPDTPRRLRQPPQSPADTTRIASQQSPQSAPLRTPHNYLARLLQEERAQCWQGMGGRRGLLPPSSSERSRHCTCSCPLRTAHSDRVWRSWLDMPLVAAIQPPPKYLPGPRCTQCRCHTSQHCSGTWLMC
mmetsp:Transcript_21140/g.48957  ORF Transcript_21140/g.48957 Transcript_21140/m.48957 type:complete len:208 (-) Transcript_21140:219-842(-)